MKLMKSAEEQIWQRALSARRDARVPAAELERRVREDLGTLSLQALGGDESALRSFFSIATSACSDWDMLTLNQWARATAIARMTGDWPVLHSFHPEITEKRARLFRQLPIGADLPLRLPHRARPWATGRGANAVVMVELQSMQITRAMQPGDFETEAAVAIRALPPLSAASANRWFDAMWQHIMVTSANAPERDKTLRNLGLSRAGKYDRVSGAAKRGAAPSARTRRSSESNIRDGIKLALKKAFFRIVKSSLPISATR